MKTVIMSLSSQAVFRNLFFFPRSFFDRLHEFLERNRDYRMVIFVPSRMRKKYVPIIGSRLHDRLVLEAADIPASRTISQKLFFFLYSYLIYTGTTKLMATMGTRPDEPPAGGNWYLAPIKLLISRTFGRSRFIKRRIVPALFMKLFSERPFAVLFKQYKPDRIFIPHLYGWYDALLIEEAKRSNVPTIGMPAGWDHLDKYFLPFHVDTLLIPSEQVGRAAHEYQAYDKNEMYVVGYPHFDFILDPQHMHTREATLQRLGFPHSSKYILYVSGSSYCPDEPDVIETMLKWMDEGRFGYDVRLVIRPYLGGRSKDKAFDEEKFNRFETHPRVVFYRPDFWGDINASIDFINIMRHADAVLAVYTTMVLEASVLDRSLVAVAFDGYHTRPFFRSIRRFEQFEHFQDVLKTGAMKTAYSFDDLFAILDRYFKDPSYGAKERQLLREKLCYKLDGKASERILWFLFTGI